MTVLIDTPVWIEFFRAKGDQVMKSRVAELIGLGRAAYTCPISFELFLGARPSELADLREGLGFAKRFSVKPVYWDMAARFGFYLRSKGLTVPASDLLIATVAVENGVAVLSGDNHFKEIRNQVLEPLELLS